MMLLLDPTPIARGLAGKKVQVLNYPDGRFTVRQKGIALPYRVFDKIQAVVPGTIVENKRLGAALPFARELQASHPPNVGRPIHDASDHRRIRRHRACRRRVAHRGRVSFELCTADDISTIRGHFL
jgi:hypothetical protein